MDKIAKIMGFEEYSDSLLESAYQVPGIKSTPQGGYEIEVVDLSDDENSDDKFEKIFISKRNEKSLGLSFLDKNGKKSDCLWVPKESLSADNPNLIRIGAYNKWLTTGDNLEKLEDFIEDFADCTETKKNWGSDRMTYQAKDDVEILLDLFDYEPKISSFTKSGDNEWTANLEDGKVIEITKRNPDDLMATFKIFNDVNSSSPSITIINKNPNPKTIFNNKVTGTIEIDGILLGLKNQSPYFKYLVKKCLGIESAEDKSLLFDYFKNMPNKKKNKSEEYRNIVKLLSDFMDSDELERIIY